MTPSLLRAQSSAETDKRGGACLTERWSEQIANDGWIRRLGCLRRYCHLAYTSDHKKWLGGSSAWRLEWHQVMPHDLPRFGQGKTRLN